jgi:hypothetical protein
MRAICARRRSLVGDEPHQETMIAGAMVDRFEMMELGLTVRH